MQEFLRNGDIHKQANELSNLERISEHSQKNHAYQIEEKEKLLSKIRTKKNAKISENIQLIKKLSSLDVDVEECNKIQQVKLSRNPVKSPNSHRDLYTRRRLVDLAKSQAQDIAILREEVERLRLRTYPAFRGTRA